MKNFNRYLKAIKIIQMENFKLKNTIHLRTQKVILGVLENIIEDRIISEVRSLKV